MHSINFRVKNASQATFVVDREERRQRRKLVRVLARRVRRVRSLRASFERDVDAGQNVAADAKSQRRRLFPAVRPEHR
jgi:hypothetical protein